MQNHLGPIWRTAIYCRFSARGNQGPWEYNLKGELNSADILGGLVDTIDEEASSFDKCICFAGFPRV